ncbi:MAG: sporulation protein YqfC [Firmicutes bacterium]|jgi:sporulation protein YqfC|uniref:Sporulation protein YqfC n=1 Tax=Sulfobacillus benefaciens TaxID=453960 RepID=A0A2T2X7I5_9FIRM|nr:sporulation protein YqfC [Bacillota bacterium]MCL5013649.1 sporulation protein YqfC [Bacillota bacterium]PSR30439.1 MAG: sporulation protein YqfC [Sulfobacillus benefaciens]HBQ96848.1 sporulation protein YqfC [Sulfobacillus sp.]
MRRGRNLTRVAQWLEIPPEVLVNVPRIEVVGHLQFRVENHRGLEKYGPDLIVLRLFEGYLVVRGEKLVIGWIDAGEILVTGEVRSLMFQEGKH